jgi:acyl carrier protein
MANQQLESPIYIKVKKIIADNLHIHEDSVHEGFRFNKFIDNLANYRIQKSGNHHLLYYLEAVNIYFDLAEEFKMEFPISLMDKNSMTVAELVNHIESQWSPVA